jgi:hypothetical protein
VKRRLPNIGLDFIETKEFDCQTGQIRSFVRDAAGKEIDLDAAFQADQKARAADPAAKVSKELRRALANHPKKRRRVLVWLNVDLDAVSAFAQGFLEPLESPLGKAPNFDEATITNIEGEILAYNRSRIAPVTQAFAKLVGNRVIHVDEYAPVVAVRANRSEVRALASHPDVESLYLELDSGELNGDALYAHRVLPEWENSGFGLGRRVAVLEREPIEDSFALEVSELYRPSAPIVSAHAQAVAGVIQSRVITRFGTAPLVQLFSANTGSISDIPVVHGTAWVMDRRVDVTNLSWGGPLAGEPGSRYFAPDGEMHYLDRFFDLHARYNLHSFVAAAGNIGNDFVHSPATAWNVIAVGNMVTGPDPDPDPSDWSNDRVSPDSSSRNPLNRNTKPNVMARGTNVRTLGIRRNSFVPIPDPGSGTSLAAPYVTATLALAMNRNATLLPSPEAAMATIMASAWNNVDGPADRPISNRDGAGAIHTSAAARVAANFRVGYRYITPASFADRGYASVPVTLEANERTRIAVTWFSDPRSHVHELGYLQTDFDIVVFEGPPDDTGFIRAASISRFNNTELVEFTPQQSGAHTIAIFAPRFLGARLERVGIAVSRFDVDAAD